MTDLLIEELAEYFYFLDGLRESGITNMLGAGPYLEEEFNMHRYDAKYVLSQWMKTFDATVPVEVRVGKVNVLGE